MPSPTGIKRHHVIDNDMIKILDEFFSLTDWKGLYLSGGTCIAEFYFGHRVSVDLDLFTQDAGLFEEAGRVLKKHDLFSVGTVEITRTMPAFCQYLVHRKNKLPIKLDLIHDIPVCLAKKIFFENIWLDSLPDLVANKLGCLIQRSDVKDYLDLYYLLPEINLPLDKLIELGQKKDAGLDPLILAHQLSYIQTVRQRPKIFLTNTPFKQIQNFFGYWRKEILDFVKA
ncbi:MAG: nucleotidyl transferase AbiEii/AbiGii toxin family protein [Deltaproteobacteria bacterium]|nr:nucleotidyl transferase AbiEii/AbiGii toxin family protein [Deltaproteobacteria bacterium]